MLSALSKRAQAELTWNKVCSLSCSRERARRAKALFMSRFLSAAVTVMIWLECCWKFNEEKWLVLGLSIN